MVFDCVNDVISRHFGHECTELYSVLEFQKCKACLLSPLSQIALMSVTVFPVRLFLSAFLMLLAWPFAFTAALGRTDFAVEPQSWWRRYGGQCWAYYFNSNAKMSLGFPQWQWKN